LVHKINEYFWMIILQTCLEYYKMLFQKKVTQNLIFKLRF
jgi:hypothetical protein